VKYIYIDYYSHPKVYLEKITKAHQDAMNRINRFQRLAHRARDYKMMKTLPTWAQQ